MAKRIGITNEKGRISIRFMREGQRFSLMGLGNWDSHSDKAKAEALVRMIEADILEGCFDTTLQKYKGGLAGSVKRLGTPVEMFAQWVESLEVNDKNYRVHYEPLAKVMFGHSVYSFQDASFVKVWENLASRTYNERIGYLKRFGAWLMGEGYLPLNPYRSLKNKPAKTTPIQPFTAQEVNAITGWMYQKSKMVGAYYEFLFLTGCRPSEALALRKVKVNQPTGYLTVDEALVRGENYETAPDKRQRKGTKTGDTRVFPLTKELTLCIVRAMGVQQDDCLDSELVFCNQRGTALDDTNLRDDYWVPCLKALNLPYRKPYTIRHTVGSMVIANGGTLADAAKLLGHKDLRMVSTTYGHAIKPLTLPDYN